jgi:hypothetical protein
VPTDDHRVVAGARFDPVNRTRIGVTASLISRARNQVCIADLFPIAEPMALSLWRQLQGRRGFL